MRALHPRYWFLYLGIGFAWLLIQILSYKILMALGKYLGVLGFYFSKRRRQIGLRNLEACFPEYARSEKIKLLKKCFEYMGQGFIEMLMAWWMPTFRLKKIKCLIEDRSGLLAKSERGLILCGGHFSSLEMFGCQVGLRYGKLHLVYQKHKDPVINKIINKGRSRYAKGLIDRTHLKSMIKALRQGDHLWYAPDQDLGRHASVFVPFFNIPCATVTSLGALLKAGDAQCLFSFFHRPENSKNSEQYYAEGTLEALPTGDSFQDTLIYSQALEKAVREHPAQYLWLHRRFKTRPEGEGKFYDF